MIYTEIQKFDSKWLKALLIIGFFVPMLFLLYGSYKQLIEGVPFGDNPASDLGLIITLVMMLVLAVVIYFVFFRSQMIIEMDETKISVKFFPLIWTERTYKKEDIESYSVEKYNSLLRYGGWGLRYRSRKELAINTSGNEGILLVLRSGKKVMLGSKNTEQFAEALNKMLNN